MKFSKFYKEFIVPPGLFASLVIGAGMFSLPYLFVQAGILAGLCYLLVFGMAFSVIHLMYAEVLAKTKEEHAFLGYSRMYLGPLGFLVSIITTGVGILLILLIYLILSSSFLRIIFPAITTDEALLAFWILTTVPIILGIKRMANVSSLITLCIFLIIIWIFVRGVPGVSGADLFTINWNNLFLPYGAILFAFAGRSAIGPIRQYLNNDKFWHDKTKPAVLIGTLIAGFFYALFALGIIGLSANGVSMDAISGISITHPLIRMGLAVLGILSIWTSYLFLGTELKNNFRFDFKWPILAASLAVVLTPPLLYFVGLNNFVGLISFSGGMLLSVESIIVVLMWWKLERQSPLRHLAAAFMIAVFVIAVIHQLQILFG